METLFEKFKELLGSNTDLIVLGISSKGIDWVYFFGLRLVPKTE